jgi:hypothetical protein
MFRWDCTSKHPREDYVFLCYVNFTSLTQTDHDHDLGITKVASCTTVSTKPIKIVFNDLN